MTPSVAGQRGLLWYRTYGTAVGAAVPQRSRYRREASDPYRLLLVVHRTLNEFESHDIIHNCLDRYAQVNCCALV